ncbi:hypothetical protein [Sphingopyxis sp. MC1]|uniref:hypothetical protein n=1 Tax=Sphingopyxis sp. MC1 TaxID=1174684 RepID=UPI0002D18CBF|nr:hypothetical protein [Sphingopyxis sp. MC1]ENY83176.1 hypothetical protein EBMC1_00005 [Sphingopyxis sp. MC1]
MMIGNFALDANGLSPQLLGLSRKEIDHLLGESPRTKRSGLPGEETFDYEAHHIRVVMQQDRAVEIAFVPPACVLFQGQPLFEDSSVWRAIVAADGDARETLGFIVLRNLGVTLTGFHDGDDSQLAMTVFAAGRWDVLEDEMRPVAI